MVTPNLSRLIDNATYRVPGALSSALLPELFAVLDEFFQTTNIWREDATFTANPTTSTFLEDPAAYTYDVTATSGQIVRLVAVVNEGGVPVVAGMPIPGCVILRNPPASSETYTATVVLSVTDPVTSEGYPVCPDWIYQKYMNGLLDGLLGRMMSQTGKPYSSPQIAMVHLKRFQSAMSRARVETTRQNVYGAQNWSFPQTWNRVR